MHHFRNAALTEDNGQATNSPNYRYRITEEALLLLRQYGTDRWDSAINSFLETYTSLIKLYSSKKSMLKMPIIINDKHFTLSTGKRNLLQKLILEEFATRFAPYSECLYIGDTAVKDLYINIKKLNALGFSITLHDKMPDVVLY